MEEGGGELLRFSKQMPFGWECSGGGGGEVSFGMVQCYGMRPNNLPTVTNTLIAKKHTSGPWYTQPCSRRCSNDICVDWSG